MRGVRGADEMDRHQKCGAACYVQMALALGMPLTGCGLCWGCCGALACVPCIRDAVQELMPDECTASKSCKVTPMPMPSVPPPANPDMSRL